LKAVAGILEDYRLVLDINKIAELLDMQEYMIHWARFFTVL